MKIWIITSWSENLTLFKFLSLYDHEYVVYYDLSHWPYGDKTFDQSFAYIQEGISFLQQHGVDWIILPPVYELHYFSWSSTSKSWTAKILPLFTKYLLDYWFTYSLTGKLGLLGDYADVQVAQTLVNDLAKSYHPTDIQKSIKKFRFPFDYRVKETPLWKYYLTSLSYSHILVNKIIKLDLRYFKDAMVDTLIPLNYWYFHYQPTITKFLNFKKIRFHPFQRLKDIFDSFSIDTSKVYSITIYYTWHTAFLLKEKRLMRLLQRGKNSEILRKHI